MIARCAPLLRTQMSKTKSNLIDPRMAARIARTYCDKYSNIGFAAASDYIESVIGDNPVQIAQVRELVIRMLNPDWAPPHNED